MFYFIKLIGPEPLIKSSACLLKIRLWVFTAALVHVYIAAIAMLPIDISVDADPKISRYEHLKWRFLTVWFNLIFFAYFPLCLHCDWKEMRGQAHEDVVSRLRRIRDVVFTSILFPTVVFADLMFWRIYTRDKSLISPPKLFAYMPWWGQHSLHTVSLIVVLLDLVLVPRRKPKSLESRFKLMMTFLSTYMLVLLASYIRGENVYQIFERLSGTHAILLSVLAYIEYSLYFFIQWFVIVCLWGK